MSSCVANQTRRLAITWRDVKDTIRIFDGSNKIPIELWTEEFVEQIIMMQWADLHNLVFAKRSMHCLAKSFVLSEKGLNSWLTLKGPLINEFKSTTNSAVLHKQLCQRKIREN